MPKKAKPIYPKELYVVKDIYSDRRRPIFSASTSVDSLRWNGFDVENEIAIYELKKIGKVKVVFE